MVLLSVPSTTATTPASVSSLTHWGRVTHICVSKLTIIGSDNGLAPTRRQANIWTSAGKLLTGTHEMAAILSRPQCVNNRTMNGWIGIEVDKYLSSDEWNENKIHMWWCYNAILYLRIIQQHKSNCHTIITKFHQRFNKTCNAIAAFAMKHSLYTPTIVQ